MKKTLLVGSLLLLSAGWGLKPFITSAAAKPAAATKQVPASSSAAQPKLELLNAGAQPLQPLRFKPRVNLKESANLTLNLNVKVSFSGTPVASKPPSTQMKMETVITKVDPNGDIHYTFRFVDVDVVENGTLPPAVMSQVRTQVKKLVGLRGSFVVNDRGQTKSGSFTIPQSVDSKTRQLLKQMSQSLEQVSAPVPDAAVGVGAKWRVSMPLTVGEITLVQTETYELVSLKDGIATLKVEVEQTAKPQRLNSPEIPKSANLMLKSLTSIGQGQTLVRFDRLLPPSATISLTSNSEIQTSNPRSAQPMTVARETQMELSIESK